MNCRQLVAVLRPARACPAPWGAGTMQLVRHEKSRRTRAHEGLRTRRLTLQRASRGCRAAPCLVIRRISATACRHRGRLRACGCLSSPLYGPKRGKQGPQARQSPSRARLRLDRAGRKRRSHSPSPGRSRSSGAKKAASEEGARQHKAIRLPLVRSCLLNCRRASMKGV